MKCPQCHFENPPDTHFCGQCAASLGITPDAEASKAQTMSLTAKELASGGIFAGRYEVIEELGKGGMGWVYKVLDKEVREKLALKLLNPEIAGEERTIERFRNELKLARQISHRHICRMYDLGREEGAYYITMEYVAGEDLKSFIHRVGQLPVGKAVAVARQVGEGLAEAHRLGIIHRDLKPQNIMIDRDGQAKVMDFGIARSFKAKGLTGAGVIVGTPEYMSPEQVDGIEPDQRSDIYALGLVLYEMLTGRLPFEGDTPLSTAVKQRTEAPPDPKKYNPQISEELKRVILKCLEKSKDKRYRTADELAAELASLEATFPLTTTPLPIRKPMTSRQITVQFTLKKLWIPALVLLVLAAAFLVWQLIPSRSVDRPTLAVFGFENQTGDASYDYLQEAIPNLLITSLEQSGRFRVTSWARLKDLLRQSGRPKTAALDEETGYDLCHRDGIEIAVVGSFVKAGDMFATDVKVMEASSKKLLQSAGARGQGVDSILRSQIDELSRMVCRQAGRIPLKLEKPQPKVMDLTTTSMEAYNYFIRGQDDYENTEFADAERFLEKAVALDPTFAVAHLYLALVKGGLLDFKGQDEAIQRSKEYSPKATEKERLLIEAFYASMIEKDSKKKLRILLELTEKYPQEKIAFLELGTIYYFNNQFAEAISEFEKAIALDPDYSPVLNMLGYAYTMQGDFVEAEAALQRYISVNPGDPNPIDSLAELYVHMGQLDKAESKYREAVDLRPDFTGSCLNLAHFYALKEDYGESARWLQEFLSRATPTAKMEGLWLVHLYEYLLGRMEKSLAGYLSLKKTAESFGSAYMMASVDMITGYIYRDIGRFEEARKAFEASYEFDKKRDQAYRPFYAARFSFELGWLALGQGRLNLARVRLSEIKSCLAEIKDLNSYLIIEFRYRLLDAEVALAGAPPEAAVVAAEKIKPRDFPGMSTPEITNYNTPMVLDILARAYRKKGDLDRAAVEYRKLMTIDPKDRDRHLIHPLYHYRLGRVLEEKGDKAGAAVEYRKFLEYWKDADQSLHEPADARKRLAALGTV